MYVLRQYRVVLHRRASPELNATRKSLCFMSYRCILSPVSCVFMAIAAGLSTGGPHRSPPRLSGYFRARRRHSFLTSTKQVLNKCLSTRGFLVILFLIFKTLIFSSFEIWHKQNRKMCPSWDASPHIRDLDVSITIYRTSRLRILDILHYLFSMMHIFISVLNVEIMICWFRAIHGIHTVRTVRTVRIGSQFQIGTYGTVDWLEALGRFRDCVV